MKICLIVQALWPAVVHAAAIDYCPPHVISSLRTSTAKALGFGKAGAQPLVRLHLLCGQPLADPGFFQVWFLSRFGDTLLSGRFFVLLTQFDLLRWYIVSPPWRDHEFLAVDHANLWRRALDGWHQHIARILSQRGDFIGLAGLGHLCQQPIPPLSLIENAQLAALREGAFITAKEQRRFNNSASGFCLSCHFTRSPSRHLRPGLPIYLTHLMPPSNPFHCSQAGA